MTSKKLIALATALFAVFAFTGVAMAADRVEVKVTSEPIGSAAICDKAGGLSLEWDTNSVIAVGDQITLDLDYKDPTTFASICKAIDMEISAIAGDAENVVANRWDLATIPVGATGPFYIVGVPATFAQAGDGVYFRVTGNINTQRITIDVMGTAGDSVTVGTAADDKLVLVLLDQQDNAVWADVGIWIPDPVTGLYTVAATPSDNTLCIDVSAWDESVVDLNMDSLGDKFTFIPSDPQVAHLASTSTVTFDTCGGKAGLDVGRIHCGVKGGQGANDTCTAFDFEDKDGYVVWAGDSRVIINSQTQPFPLTNYQIKLDVLVNGMGGDNGVYISREAVQADGFPTNAAACAANPNAMPVAGALANYIYYDGLGNIMANANVAAPVVAGAGSCDLMNDDRAVSVLTDENNLTLVANDDFILVNLPAFNYDLDDITQDDVVSVRVTLIKAPCGTIFEDVIQIGTMCAEIVMPPLVVNTLVYPYFTAMANDNWWDGLVIINLTNMPGNFTVIVYEQDGDVGSVTGTITANGLYQMTMVNLQPSMTIAVAGGSGVMGDSLCYALVCTDFIADGFAMIASTSSNVSMDDESMGYIPRVDYYNMNDRLTFCQSLGVVPGTVYSP